MRIVSADVLAPISPGTGHFLANIVQTRRLSDPEPSETAAPARGPAPEKQTVPTVDVFNDTSFVLPRRSANRRLSADDEEAIEWNEIFFDWGKSRSLSHMNSLFNAMAFMALDDLLCRKYREFGQAGRTPDTSAEHMEKYLVQGRYTGSIGNREKDHFDPTDTRSSVGAFMRDGQAHIDWPIMAGTYIENWMRSRAGRLSNSLPKFAEIVRGPVSRSLESVFDALVFPTGKYRGRLAVEATAEMKRTIANAYHQLVGRSQARRDRKIDVGKIGKMLEMCSEMTISLSSPVDPDAELGYYNEPTGRNEKVKLMDYDGEPDTEILTSYRYLMEDANIDTSVNLHVKLAVPRKIANHICQSEDCHVGKIYKAARRLVDMAYPDNGVMNDSKFEAVRPSLAVKEADELDASAEFSASHNGHDVYPIKGSELTDDNDLSVGIKNGQMIWIPKSVDRYRQFNDEMQEQNTVEMGGERVMSPFMNNFLNDLSPPARDESQEDTDKKLAWANRRLGNTTFVKTREKKSEANIFLKASTAFGQVIYTNADGDQKTMSVDGNRPATRSAYLSLLKLPNAAYPGAQNKVEQITSKKSRMIYSGVLTDFGKALKAAGISDVATDYMRQEDFAAILPPEGSLNLFLERVYFPRPEDWQDTAWRILGAAKSVKRALLELDGAEDESDFTARGRNDVAAWLNSRESRLLVRETIGERLRSLLPLDPRDISPGQWEVEFTTYDLMSLPVFGFFQRAVSAMHRKIGGDYTKIMGKDGMSYARLSQTAPLYIVAAKYGTANGGLAALESEAQEENSMYDPEYGDGMVNKEAPKLPLTGKDNIFLPHQMKAEYHLKRKPKYAVLDVDAGGGKTFIAIMDMLRFMRDGAEKILVVCPGQLVAQYTEEVVKFTDGKLNVFPINTVETFNGYFDKKQGELLTAILDAPRNTVFVMASGIFQLSTQERSLTGNVVTIPYEGASVERNVVVEAMRQVSWDVIYVDESHQAKSQSATYYMGYARLLETAKNIRLMSGTFVYNTVNKDLIGQASLMDPSIFGDSREFQFDFMESDTMFSQEGQRRAMEKLARNVDLVQIRRANWAQTLPNVKQQFHPVSLSEKQREVYEIMVELMSIHGALALVEAMMDQSKENSEDDEIAGVKEDRKDEVDLDELSEREELQERAHVLARGFLLRTERFLSAPGEDTFVSKDLNKLKVKLREAETQERRARRSGDQTLVSDAVAHKRKVEAEMFLVEKMAGIFAEFSAEDKISPKVKYLLNRNEEGNLDGLIHRHFNPHKFPDAYPEGVPSRNEVGKVMIYVSYRDSAAAIYKYIRSFREYKDRILLYTAEKKKDLVDVMKSKDNNFDIVVGVENSLNTGFNFQMFSRLIRMELVWTPGALEQGESRINRPDVAAYLEDKVRKTSYLDVVSVDRSLDITKSMKLIAKNTSNTKANNLKTKYVKEDGQDYFGKWEEKDGTWEYTPLPEDTQQEAVFPYDDVPDPNLLSMTRENIRSGHSFSYGEGRDYWKLQEIVSKMTDKDVTRQREIIAADYPEKTYKADDLGVFEGAAVAEVPEVSQGKLPFAKELGLLTLSEKAQSKGKISSQLEMDDLVGERELLVHTMYGDGKLHRLSATAATVDFDGFKKTGIPRNSLYFISDPRKLRGKSVREAIAGKLGMEYKPVAHKDLNKNSGMSADATENLRMLRQIAVDGDLDTLRRLAEEMGLVDDASRLKTNTLLELFHENPSKVEDYEFSLENDDALGEDDAETQELADRALQAHADMLEDDGWTKAALLESVLDGHEGEGAWANIGIRTENGRKLTKRNPWYKSLERKRKKGILDELMDKHPIEFLNLYNRFNGEDEVELDDEPVEETIEETVEERPAVQTRKKIMPLEVLQINNLIAVTVDKEKLDAETAGKLRMREVGAYWYFDCSTHLRINAFMDKLEKGEKAKKYDILKRHRRPLQHLQNMLNKHKNDDRLRVMNRAQKVDIRNFFREKVTRARKQRGEPVPLELWPVVHRDAKGDRRLFVMAWEEGQQDVVKFLRPGRFKTAYRNQTWKHDEEGFWLKVFEKKDKAKSWLEKLDKSAVLDDTQYKLGRSNYDKALQTLREIRVLKIVADPRKLQGEDANLPR